MSFIEEYRALLKVVEDFDERYSSFDFSILSDDDLLEASKTRLALWSVDGKIGRERMDRASRHNEEMKKKQEARYGYYFSKRHGCNKDEINAIDLIRVEAYELGIIEAVHEQDVETARKRIHEIIPTITDEEIDEYRRQIVDTREGR